MVLLSHKGLKESQQLPDVPDQPFNWLCVADFRALPFPSVSSDCSPKSHVRSTRPISEVAERRG